MDHAAMFFAMPESSLLLLMVIVLLVLPEGVAFWQFFPRFLLRGKREKSCQNPWIQQDFLHYGAARYVCKVAGGPVPASSLRWNESHAADDGFRCFAA
ncbi:hypothetical protein MITSMUL_03738 [Mitsuokella multacida DSM 20544]|uniref:Uncharacterized protein n=1 Tax=Mitsuokella multacida DSM 20544 TaxID=500635 RepID=C9KKN9_9FIRM|nr:hypothetical protein MITSMUL_03738 [Mitsuokella multacida DSM 20544]